MKRAVVCAALAGLGILAAATVAIAATSPGRAALDRGTALYAEERYAEAIAAFREAAEIDPGLLPAWENLGWALHRAGRDAEAVETWQRLLKVDPARPDVLDALGELHLAAGRPAEASAALASSLALEPDRQATRRRLSVALERSGDLEGAERALVELSRRQPGDLDPVLRLADFYGRTGRAETGLALLRDPAHAGQEEALRLGRARLHAHAGRQAYEREAWSEARDAWGEAVRLDPAAVQYRIDLGWAHRRGGDLQRATAAWREALRLDPGRGGLHRHIADAERERGDRAAAARHYALAWEAEPDPAVAYRLAEIALAEKRLDEARTWLDALLSHGDAETDWPRRAAGLFVENEQTSAGIAFFEERLPGAPRADRLRRALAQVHLARGSAASAAGDHASAARELTAALSLDPDDARALRDLGWVHWAAGDLASAEAVWRRYAAAHPTSTEPLNLLTRLHLQRGAAPAAVESAEASLRLDPEQPGERLNLARALEGAGRFGEARRLAEALAREQPDHAAAQVFWGELLMLDHDFERGEAQWRRVLGLGVDDPRADAYWVQSLYELGRYDEALRQARARLATRGPDARLLDLLARDALQRGRPDEAVDAYRRSARAFPERLDTWLALGRLLVDADELSEAREAFERARRLHPDALEVEVALAQLERRAGRTGTAYAAFRALAAAHPHQREIFRGLLESALEAGRPGEALRLLAAGRDRLEDHDARRLEARIYQAAGRREAALSSLAPLVDPPEGTVYLPALLYHGLGAHERSASLPVALFDSQMAALRRAGYTALGVAELVRLLDAGRALPARPILITFDDARRDSFRLAQPVLERHDLRATMFVPTGRLVEDHPFFADWESLARHVSSGRWELQSHGHHAHDPIALDAEGTEGSFLVNRRWLPEEQRLESLGEYRARIDEDHARSKREIEARIPGAEVVGYAFPFSEAGQESDGNEPQAREANAELLARHFRLGFVQDGSGYNTLRPGSPPRLLRRLSVPRDWDGEALLQHLAAEFPPAAALAQRARLHDWNGHPRRARLDLERLRAQHPRLAGDAAYGLALLSSRQGWNGAAEAQLRTAQRLGSARLDADPLLTHRIEWAASARLEPRLDFTGDSDGREMLVQRLDVRPGPLGPLELRFGGGRVTLREEGFTPLEGRELGASFRVARPGPWSLQGAFRQRDIDGGVPSTLSLSGRLGFEGEAFALVLRGGREDVETLRARRRGLQSDVFGLRTSLRLGLRGRATLDATAARLDDGNRRRDVAGRLLVEPRWAGGLGFGAAAGWSDTAFQTPDYYAPEDLRWLRGLVSYRQAWGAGWRIDLDAGIGVASDGLRGRRLTGHLRGRAEQVWSRHLHTLLEGRYSASPGYRGWGLGGLVQLGF